jgi:2-keto-3-deoxy-L-rhamnonate aldolase RhmA
MFLLDVFEDKTRCEGKLMTGLQQFRNKMDSGVPCLGPSVTLKDPVIAEALGPDSDFLWIDTEHSPMSIETVTAHLLGARACNKPALVRVPGSLTESIKPVLDSGVDGIIVPQVTGVDEVKKVVADCRYPPSGNRGFGVRRGMDYGRKSLEKYLKESPTDLFVAVMIEHENAVREIEEIVDIPGLDSVVIGTMDLSGSLGHLGDRNHPSVVSAIQTIIDSARKKNVYVGMGLASEPELARHWLERGVQWIQFGLDYEYMVQGAARLFGSVR